MYNTIMLIIALLTTGIFIGTTIAVSMESVLLLNVIINKIFKKMDEIIKFFIFLPFFPLIFILTSYLNFMAGAGFVPEKTGYAIILRLIAVIMLDMFILIPLFRKIKKINKYNDKGKGLKMDTQLYVKKSGNIVEGAAILYNVYWKDTENDPVFKRKLSVILRIGGYLTNWIEDENVLPNDEIFKFQGKPVKFSAELIEFKEGRITVENGKSNTYKVKNLILEPIIEKTEENNKKKGFDNMENLKQELREKADKLEELTGLAFKASVKNNGERNVKKVIFSPDLVYPYEKVILDVDTGDITFAFSNETTLMMGDPKKYIKKADEIFKMYQKL